jgi:transketolase
VRRALTLVAAPDSIWGVSPSLSGMAARKEFAMTGENAQEKKKFQRKMQSQLDEWMDDLAVLKEKAAQATAEVRQDLRREIQALEPQIQKGKAKLAELANSSDDAWDALKAGAESTWRSLKASIAEARAKYRK